MLEIMGGGTARHLEQQVEGAGGGISLDCKARALGPSVYQDIWGMEGGSCLGEIGTSGPKDEHITCSVNNACCLAELRLPLAQCVPHTRDMAEDVGPQDKVMEAP